MSVNKFEEICRLCSSKENLVSMFHGKSRNIRDILRKLIYDTVSTDIDPNDNLPKTVCLNCCIDVYNFYNFRHECIQNENFLKALELEVSTKPKKQKLNHVDLSKFKLPDQEYVRNTLATWLTQKQSDIKGISITSEKSEGKSQIRPEVISIAIQTEHATKSECQSIQTDQIFVKEKTIQVDIKKKSSRKATQTFHVQFEEIGSQTNIKTYLDKSTEISEQKSQIMPEVISVAIQTENVAKTQCQSIQTDQISIKEKVTQADIKKKSSKKATQTSHVQAEEIGSQTNIKTYLDKSTEISELSPEQVEKVKQTLHNDMYIQTESPHAVDKIVQANIKTKTSRKFIQTLPVKIINMPSESDNVVTDNVSFENKSNDVDIYVQTKPLNVGDKKIQCDFTKLVKNNYDLKRNKIESVIRSLGKTDKSAQCELIKNTNISTVTDAKSTQTSSFFSTRRRHTQTDSELSSSEKKTDDQIVKKNEIHCKESVCQTDSVRIIEDKLEQNCTCLQKSDLESLDKITQTTSVTFNNKKFQTDNIMTTMCDENIQCELIPTSDAKILLKMDFKEEFPSPSSRLHIDTDSSLDSKLFASPKTPTTSDLLEVRDHSEVVKLCRLCDKTFYNEREQRLHRKTHMQCKLCKKHFRSFKGTEEHLKLCLKR